MWKAFHAHTHFNTLASYIPFLGISSTSDLLPEQSSSDVNNSAMSLTSYDPWDWSIDTVVAYFCDPQGPLFPRFSNSINRNDLEAVLRDNQLSGDLILEVDDNAARGYLGIRTIGALIGFRRALQALRQQSAKWQIYLAQNTSSTQSLPNLFLSTIAGTGVLAISSDGQPGVPSTQPAIPIQQSTIPGPSAPTARSNEGRRVAPLLILDRVQNRNSSTEGTPKQGSTSQDQVNHDVPAAVPQLNDGEDHLYDHLLDWENASDDEVLPAFGDSDEEDEGMGVSGGDQDSEDGEEEEVRGAIANDEAESDADAEKDYDSDEEWETASNSLRTYMEDAEIEQLSIWETEKLPKLESQAYKYWTEARNRTVIRDHLSNQVVQLKSRLGRLEKQVLDAATESDLDRLVEVLQPTLVDIATAEWKIELLSRDVAPERPNDSTISRIKKQRQVDREANEEDLTSEDDNDDDSDDDDDADEKDGEEEGEEDEEKEEAAEVKIDDGRNEEESETTTDNNSDTDEENENDHADVQDLEMMDLEEDDAATDEPSHLEDYNLAVEPTSTRITSTSEDNTGTPNDEPLPAFWNIEAWRQKQSTAWSDYLIEHKKREHLLGWNVAHDLYGWDRASHYIGHCPEDQLPWAELRDAIEDLIDYGETHIRSCVYSDVFVHPAVIQIAIWFTYWENMQALQQEDLSKTSLEKVLKVSGGSGRYSFSTFWTALKEIKTRWNASWDAQGVTIPTVKSFVPTSPAKTDMAAEMEQDSKPSSPANVPADRKRSAVDANIDDAETTRRRVKRLKKDRAARLQREDASARMMQHNRNAQNIQPSHRDTPQGAKVYINPGAENHKDLICINNSIAAYLKRNQKDGIAFLWRECVEAGQGALLAHTMGLGKTLQCITLLSTITEAASIAEYDHLIPQGLRSLKTAIVAPASLTENWRDEISKWALRKDDGQYYAGEVYLIDSEIGPDRRLEVLQSWSSSKYNAILLTSYTMLDRLTSGKDYTQTQRKEIQDIIRHEADIVIADEAQYIKNWKAKAAIALHTFTTPRRIALTGSPLNNNLEEYYAIISWACPNFLGPMNEFRSIYVHPITRGLYNDSAQRDYRKALVQLRKLEHLLQPKVHRAGWEDIPDMPRKTEFMLHLPPTNLQRAVYNALMDAVTQTPIGNPSIVVMSLFNTVRLLTFHPSYFEEKLLADKEQLLKAQRNPARPLPVPVVSAESNEDLTMPDENLEIVNEKTSQTFLSLDLIQMLLNVYQEHRSTEIRQQEVSHKLSMVIKIVECSEDEKVLIFSQSLKILDGIEGELRHRKISLMRIDGRTSNAQQRQQIVKSFNNDPTSAQVMLVSTKAGGVGLNLFAASRIVICDQSWNPMNEQQAIGRAYRLGQQNHVFVYRLMIAGSYENALQNQAIYKEQLASRVVENKAPDRSAVKDFGKFLRPLVPT